MNLIIDEQAAEDLTVIAQQVDTTPADALRDVLRVERDRLQAEPPAVRVTLFPGGFGAEVRTLPDVAPMLAVTDGGFELDVQIADMRPTQRELAAIDELVAAVCAYRAEMRRFAEQHSDEQPA